MTCTQAAPGGILFTLGLNIHRYESHKVTSDFGVQTSCMYVCVYTHKHTYIQGSFYFVQLRYLG